MRIAFLTNLYPPYVVGGYEMVCGEVVAALRARGHEVSVLCGRGRNLPPDVHGVLPLDLDRKEETFLGGRTPSALEAFRWHVFDPGSYGATRRLLRRLNPEVIAVWNLALVSLGPLAAAARSGRPVVTHALDKWLHHSLSDAGPVLKLEPLARSAVLGAQRLLRPLLRRAVHPLRVVAVSEYLKRFYVDAGLSPDDLQVVHLGVDVAHFSCPDRSLRPPAGPLRLLYVGGLWEGKGPQTAVRALGILEREGLHAHLDVCGSGTPEFLEWLRGVIAAEGVAARVTLHGFVDRKVVRDLCQSHDVLLFPSQWDEPFAAVPVEAMSTGMAVVATTAGGTPEALTDGETGLLVPPGDPFAMAAAVRRLAEDPALRLRLGSAAARSVRERFSFERYVDRLESCYKGLLEGRPEVGTT